MTTTDATPKPPRKWRVLVRYGIGNYVYSGWLLEPQRPGNDYPQPVESFLRASCVLRGVDVLWVEAPVLVDPPDRALTIVPLHRILSFEVVEFTGRELPF